MPIWTSQTSRERPRPKRRNELIPAGWSLPQRESPALFRRADTRPCRALSAAQAASAGPVARPRLRGPAARESPALLRLAGGRRLEDGPADLDPLVIQVVLAQRALKTDRAL